jgi:membrane protein
MILEQTSLTKQGAIAGAIGVVTLILGATAVFGELQSAMNLIWKVPPGEGGFVGGISSWLRQRFLSLTMVLAVSFLLLVSLVISAVIAGLSEKFSGSDLTRVLFAQVVNQVLSIPILTLLFALLFKYIPDVAVRWREVWAGALLSALIFTFGKYVIGLYLGHASIGSAYGAAGSLVVLLVWVYFSALLLLFGAEFTQAYARRSRGETGSSHRTSKRGKA